MAWSGSCPSLRKTRAIEIHVKCHSFQLSTQTFNASCQQGRFYLQKGGQLGLQFLPSPRHTCTCPRAGHISQHAEPAPHSIVPIPGAALCRHWEAVSPVLGHRAAALRCRHAPRAVLLLSFSSGSQFYCAIKLLPPLRDKPARRRRARITLDQ